MILVLGMLGLFLIISMRSETLTWRAYLALFVGCCVLVSLFTFYRFFLSPLTVPVITPPGT